MPWLIFIKKYWKEMAVAAAIITVIVAMGIMIGMIKKKNKDIADLKNSVSVLESSVKSFELAQKTLTGIVKGQNLILKQIQEREAKADTVFREKVINNREVVEKYVEKPEDAEARAAYWRTENELWTSILGEAQEVDE